MCSKKQERIYVRQPDLASQGVALKKQWLVKGQFLLAPACGALSRGARLSIRNRTPALSNPFLNRFANYGQANDVLGTICAGDVLVLWRLAIASVE